jgi:hypothetical protein
VKRLCLRSFHEEWEVKATAFARGGAIAAAGLVLPAQRDDDRDESFLNLYDLRSGERTVHSLITRSRVRTRLPWIRVSPDGNKLLICAIHWRRGDGESEHVEGFDLDRKDWFKPTKDDLASFRECEQSHLSADAIGGTFMIQSALPRPDDWHPVVAVPTAASEISDNERTFRGHMEEARAAILAGDSARAFESLERGRSVPGFSEDPLVRTEAARAASSFGFRRSALRNQWRHGVLTNQILPGSMPIITPAGLGIVSHREGFDVWDLRKRQCLRRISRSWGIRVEGAWPPLVVSADGRLCLSFDGGEANDSGFLDGPGSRGQLLMVHEIETGCCLAQLARDKSYFEPICFVGFADSQTAICATRRGELFRWSFAQPQLEPLPGPPSFEGLVEMLTPDGRFCLSQNANLAYVWDLAEGRRVATGMNAARVKVLRRDGRMLLGATEAALIAMMEVRDGFPERRTWREPLTIALAVSADGGHFVSANTDRIIGLWDAAAGARVTTFEGHPDKVTGVAISDDGSFVLSADEQGVRLWEMEWRYERRNGDEKDARISKENAQLDWAPPSLREVPRVSRAPQVFGWGASGLAWCLPLVAVLAFREQVLGMVTASILAALGAVFACLDFRRRRSRFVMVHVPNGIALYRKKRRLGFLSRYQLGEPRNLVLSRQAPVIGIGMAVVAIALAIAAFSSSDTHKQLFLAAVGLWALFLFASPLYARRGHCLFELGGSSKKDGPWVDETRGLHKLLGFSKRDLVRVGLRHPSSR